MDQEMSWLLSKGIGWVEKGRVPDWLVRWGIRQWMLKPRAAEFERMNCEQRAEETVRFIVERETHPLALAPKESNQQHYEVPSEFFLLALGKRLKYSSCYWDAGTTTLDQAEENALRITCERAGLADGMKVLELGCGWGSLSLWMAEKYPTSKITVVSHSSTQKQFIDAKASERGFKNLTVITSDINDFQTEKRFDRVVSVEMFEHVSNHQRLFQQIAGWLRDDGKLFTHVFCHKEMSYAYIDQGPQDWMTRYFFAGGMMPGDKLFLHYQKHLKLENQWRWNGSHYGKTSDAWLSNMDKHRKEILAIFQKTYGADAAVWVQRWRVFFIACAELFHYARGNEWWVSHYLFSKR